MQFPSLSLFTMLALAGSALGNLHASCTCHNGDSEIVRMTTDACTFYTAARYEWGGAFFDAPSGECIANQDASIAGDQWEDACKSIAAAGFPCANGVGVCFANPDDVTGSC